LGVIGCNANASAYFAASCAPINSKRRHGMNS
jgi:hypothetical protein